MPDDLGRRPPAAVRRALPLERRERTLLWARCESGCALVVTTHGFWEWPHRLPPTRHCWRVIDRIGDPSAPGLSVCSAGQVRARCAHRVADPAVEDTVRELDRASRHCTLRFTLPSGSRLNVRARQCTFERVLVWTVDLDAAATADPDADSRATAALLDRARSDYGDASVGADPERGTESRITSR